MRHGNNENRTHILLILLAIPAERLEANGIRHLKRLTALKAHYAAKGLPSRVTNTPPPHIVERDDRRRFRSSTCTITSEGPQGRKANARQHSNPPIVPESIGRRGRSSASSLDGTVLVASSQQPFLDADAVDDQVGRPNVHQRKARSDGLFAVGWADDADGPFESCGFAQVGTAEESPDEIFRRAE